MTDEHEREGRIIRLGEVLERLDPTASFEVRQEHIKNMLARYLNLKTVVALIGTGASIPLGYPSWTQFAKDTLRNAQTIIPNEKDTLEKYLEYLEEERGKELSAQVMLGECEKLCGYNPEFRKNIQEYFEEKHKKFPNTVPKGGKTPDDKFSINHNPYLALLELPISRFITTNYDFEIERALMLTRKISNPFLPLSADQIKNASQKSIIDSTIGKSFSQKAEFREELAKFPLARYDDNRYMIFHCHGRIDDIKSCIITEEDYQRWYLKEVPGSIPFRQTLDLTLGSNPILIIGYGLGDVDLMRWLRMITANRPDDKSRNPLFCINYIPKNDFEVKWNEDEKLIEAECNALYLRYGLHVIPVYPRNGVETTLCQVLLEQRDRWKSWWDGLLQKPKFRPIPTANFGDRSYYHYKIDFEKSGTQIPSVQKKLRDRLDAKLQLESLSQPGLAVVVGDGGTGKSWSVQKYLMDKEANSDGQFIFWSSYYANDVLTGIDRLIEFLSQNGRKKQDGEVELNEAAEDRFEKLISLLRRPEQKNTVIVFDGIEKLLTPDRVQTDGKSLSPEVQRFFQIISANRFNHTGQKGEPFTCNIILTTRLFPIDILPSDSSWSREERQNAHHENRKQIEIITSRCWKEDLLGSSDGSTIEGIEISNSFIKELQTNQMFGRRKYLLYAPLLMVIFFASH